MKLTLLKTTRAVQEIIIVVESVEIFSRSSVKYLGVYFDRNIKMVEHIGQSVTKAEKVLKALQCVTFNMDGPVSSERRIFECCELRGSVRVPIWKDTLRHKRYKEPFMTLHRRVALSTFRQAHPQSIYYQRSGLEKVNRKMRAKRR